MTNSEYYFLTMHGSITPSPSEVRQALEDDFPNLKIHVSDEKFKAIR